VPVVSAGSEQPGAAVFRTGAFWPLMAWNHLLSDRPVVMSFFFFLFPPATQTFIEE